MPMFARTTIWKMCYLNGSLCSFLLAMVIMIVSPRILTRTVGTPWESLQCLRGNLFSMRPRAPTNDTGNLFVVLLNSKMLLFLTMCCLKLLTKFVMLLWHSDMLLFITTCCYPNMGHPHDSVFCLSSLAKCCYSFLAEPLFSDGLLRILNGALSCAICCIVREISARRKLLPRPWTYKRKIYMLERRDSSLKITTVFMLILCELKCSEN